MISVKKHQHLSAVLSALMAVILLLGVFGISTSANAAKAFSPRLTAPTGDNPYYFSSMNPFYACGYGMPNCTAYAFGRAYEILGTRPNLCESSASQWYSYNRNNGYYPYGREPKLGAIVCWANHVAVVEKINGNTITISESHRSHGFFDTYQLTKGNEGSYCGGFQGYIYILGGSTISFFPQLVKDKGYASGYYTVNTDGPDLRVRISASTDGEQITSIPDGTEVYVEEVSGNWGKVNYNGRSGWICLDYCNNFKGVAKVDKDMFYFNKDKIDYSSTDIVKSGNGYYYVENGTVNKDYNGVASNDEGTWLIKNGKVDFTGTGNYTFNGKDYTVLAGKVIK